MENIELKDVHKVIKGKGKIDYEKVEKLLLEADDYSYKTVRANVGLVNNTQNYLTIIVTLALSICIAPLMTYLFNHSLGLGLFMEFTIYVILLSGCTRMLSSIRKDMFIARVINDIDENNLRRLQNTASQ